MIAIEAALSVFLLCGAGLVRPEPLDPHFGSLGFDPKTCSGHAAEAAVAAGAELDRPEGRPRIFRNIWRRSEAIPGVESAATVTGPPLRPARIGNAELGALKSPMVKTRSFVGNHLVSPDYFRTLRIPLLAGRMLSRSDAGPRVRVAVVNEEWHAALDSDRTCWETIR